MLRMQGSADAAYALADLLLSDTELFSTAAALREDSSAGGGGGGGGVTSMLDLRAVAAAPAGSRCIYIPIYIYGYILIYTDIYRYIPNFCFNSMLDLRAVSWCASREQVLCVC